ncbi:MAG: sodium-dependent transporter [Lentisphaeria bacterium]|nr:sodium-dependent transporter [Lentisphaeria bacterium]
MAKQREQFASRLGFIFLTAGCAIGLGNVWRFPYVTGQYGGGLFVLLYLLFLIIMGFPVLTMELALGRAGRSTFPGAFAKLQNPQNRFRWRVPGFILFSGNLILLMFYTVVTGWLLAYAWMYLSGRGTTLNAEDFSALLAAPGRQTLYTFIALAISAAVCMGGVRGAIEKSIKFMMGGLFLMLAGLVANALLLPGAGAGVKFFLQPDFTRFAGGGLLPAIHAAMAQAFFTLSIGIGALAVCGSYSGRERALPQESFWIILLDTVVAICAGLVIFPSCQAFGIAPDAGPPLIFITLPRVFQNMSGGTFWGALFFLFLAIAALSTLIAVFENLAAFGMDEFHWSRRRSCAVFAAALALLSLPCVFGFNFWRNFHPLGGGSTILDLEDFVVSNNLLPLGALCLTVFCMHRAGWGEEGFYAEVNAGSGWKIPRWPGFYCKWVLPLLIFAVWMLGLSAFFD